MQETINLVDKEATGHLTRAEFVKATYIPKDKRKTILLLSDDL